MAIRKVEYSKRQVGGVTLGLFILLQLSLVLISFAGLFQYQTDAIVSIMQAVTTQTGVAITNYSVKAGVENTSKIKNAYQEAKSIVDNQIIDESVG